MPSVSAYGVELMELSYEDESVAPDGTKPRELGSVRLTVAAYRALLHSGAWIRTLTDTTHGLLESTVVLERDVPGNLVAARIAGSNVTLLRCGDEPPQPNEAGLNFWAQVDFTPCPSCHAPLLPDDKIPIAGYRVCAHAPHHRWCVRPSG